MSAELLVLVKHDCHVCDQILPLLDRAAGDGVPLRLLSQSGEEETAGQVARLGMSVVPDLDTDLELTQRFEPEAVPCTLLLDGGEELARVEGIDRPALAEMAERAGVALDLGELPELRPGCASAHLDPAVAGRVAAQRARREGRIASRTVEIGGLEDPFEALFDRGLTDGLPVVPPTPERVVRMLSGTSRDPREIVGSIPPYDGEATVEKVAVNAVMAGCEPRALPVVLAAVDAACREEFALQGLIATTHPSGPTIVVSGPYSEIAGMNSRGNALGQGTRANVTIGRALQLVVRNVGGGRPGVEDRAAHGQMGKLSSCFAERLEDSPWGPMSEERGIAPADTGVTLISTEAPRLVIDQLARDPEGLLASVASVLETVGHPKLRLAFDAMVVLGPEHGRILREAGWSRERTREALHELTHARAGDIVRGAGGSPEGVDPAFVSDPEMRVAKFAAPDRILLAHAGGDAGLFSMIYGSWAAGEIGSAPVTARVEDWV